MVMTDATPLTPQAHEHNLFVGVNNIHYMIIETPKNSLYLENSSLGFIEVIQYWL